MDAEIIGIGTEILLGHIVNTNAAYLSRKLAELGINIYHQSTVGDNHLRLSQALKEALSRSDIIITTGGLGPTVDDITTEVISGTFSRKLVFNKNVLKDIQRYFRKKRFRKMPLDVKRQAYVPQGAVIFKNNVGTAPGMLLNEKSKIIIALPGPPREVAPIFEKNVIPYLRKKGFAGRYIIKTKTIKIIGLAESAVNAKVKDLLSMSGDVTVGIYAHLGEVELKITAKAKNEKEADKGIKRVEEGIRREFGNHIYGVDKEMLEEAVGKLLLDKKKTISVAESCTGGLVANRITNVSGSSKYFKEGIVAYSNEAKERLLSVSHKTLVKFGAVSKQAAEEMAKGVRALSASDIGIGITGIAGPTGGTKAKPVGLVYISIATDGHMESKEYRFSGSRQDIKWQASIAALDLVRRILLEHV